ncbi:hypothetical protein KY495_13020 [Massilia sp. PAMC28688]|uniref:hypothetical protein n=1 Tax=Massilia sp. PAMC28688 TaxID=2861283 RepID=UPI001C62AF66|nr:hypothetical protein [Massilia sp. PAMC28688]QYF91723.1 hypothetical protein KY495_13020 [Massilia sp. PAMC28688]
MKSFENILFLAGEKTIYLKFAAIEEALTMVRINAVIEVSRDDVPLGVELFDASELGSERLQAIICALTAGKLNFAYDPDIDILTININAIDEDSVAQRPGNLGFGFSNDGRLCTLTVA